ncbi:MAG: cytidine deaminase [Alphaproteobacteria bacterium]|nr:MAG: cytidine deaminase [Alphaproteobacteria bacterium]
MKHLVEAARQVRAHAHAPYSGFAVGAALATPSGIHVGCNVENVAYPEGSCAETGAIAAMVAAGERVIEAVAVWADSPEPIAPCGGCRQRLAEFAAPGVPVLLAGPHGVVETTLGALLPAAFGPGHLGRGR